MTTGNQVATAATKGALTKPPKAFSVTAIRDYLTCPRMYYFARVLGLQRESTSFAGFFGQAVHWSIANWHSLGRRDPVEVLLADYERKIEGLIQKAQADGLTIDGFDGPETLEKYRALATEMFAGYHADPRNQVELVVNEHRFEVEITSSTKKVYLFSGYVDQVRRHPDGSLHLVDLKTGQTRPSDHLLTLDEQLSLYAIAMVRGRFMRPGKPDDENPPFTIGQAPASLSLAMLRDYGSYAKNEFTEFIDDPSGAKVKNPETGRLVKAKIPNPKFAEGYKKGERKGPVFYRTQRSAFDLRQAEIDLARVCGSIRMKQFFRRPSAHGSCDMCRFRAECVQERAEPI
ncbi:MAG: PD-(D/E)XK nuclease family protein [Gemmatimonadales bacterium]|nr:PD-(D/E)XK nuclease family protein [Gemmatimonadales bacterium]